MLTQPWQECWCSEVNTEMSGGIKVNPLWIFYFYFLFQTWALWGWFLYRDSVQVFEVHPAAHQMPQWDDHLAMFSVQNNLIKSWWDTALRKWEISGALSVVGIRVEEVRWTSKEWVKMGPENWELPILWFLCGFSHLEWDWAGKVKQWPR